MTTFNGTPGDDSMTGGAGDDVLNGFAGNDTLYGGKGNDLITGGAGNDSINGGDGTDTAVFTGIFTDYLISYNAGVDSGTETYVISDTSANRDGTDHVQGVEWFQFADGIHPVQQLQVINGTAGNDSLTGGGLSEVLNGLDGNDTLNGGAGNDTLCGGDGNDLLNGGDGSDTASYTGATGSVNVSLAVTGAQATGGAGTDTLTAIENLAGGGGNDTLSGNAADNFIYGSDGDDVLHGGGGNDSLSGGAGNDLLDGGQLLAGGTGSDSLVGGDNGAVLYSDAISPYFVQPDFYHPAGLPPLLDTGSERDTLVGGAGDDQIFAGYGDNVDGGQHSWRGDRLCISFEGASGGVHADFRLLETQPFITVGGATITNIQQISWLQGSEFDDFLAPIEHYYSDYEPVYGMGGDDHIIAASSTGLIDGGEGNDLLDASGAADSYPVFGGAGDDTILGGIGESALHGGDGNDLIVGTVGSDIISGDAGNDTIYTGHYSNDVDGGDGNDLITAYEGWDRLAGGDGDDTLTGGGGNDQLAGGAGVDTAIFSGPFTDYVITYDSDARTFTVADTVAGRDGTDTASDVESFQFADTTKNAADAAGITILNGAAGDDSLVGGDGLDVIYAGGGNDVLQGAGGVDTLYGEAGNDTLVGGAGNDGLHGGDGADAAVFTGNFVDYAITYEIGRGTYLISDTVAARDGTDRVDGIENFQFADGARTAAQLHATVLGTDYSEQLTGTADADAIQGAGGNDTLSGLGGDDTLNGGTGDDLLLGGDGNDLLAGGSGENNLDGGAGSDTAVFAGSLADYSVAHNSVTGVYTVVDGMLDRDGVNIVVNVEYLQFADGTRAAADAVNDTAIYGTQANDHLVGTGAADVINGLSGDDSIEGGGGDDLLKGWQGNDTLLGGAGNDTLVGGDGANVLAGGDGSDSLVAGDGGGSLYSGAVTPPFNAPYFSVPALPPLLDTGAQADTLVGGAGNDNLFAGYGDDVDGGGNGWDGDRLYISFEGAPSGVSADFRPLESQPSITVAGATIANIESIAWLQGSEFDDFLAPIESGFPNWAPVYGMGGNDTIIGDYYTGLIDGGDGNDLLDASASSYGFPVYGGAGDDTLIGGYNSQLLDGGAGNDVFYGDSYNGLDIVGGTGTDTAVFVFDFAHYAIAYYPDSGRLYIGLTGLQGVEYVQFADGTKLASQLIALTGTLGNDLLAGTAGPDEMNGLAGNDTLNGAAGDDTLNGGAGNDVLNGGDGNDSASYVGAAGAVKVSLATTSAQVTGGAGTDTLTGIENLIGGDGNDSLTGNALANRLEGGSGDDTLIGGAGADTMAGGDGNDSYLVDNSGDVVSENYGDGYDLVTSSVSYSLSPYVDALTLSGSATIDGTGNDLPNALTGNGAANVLTGNGGNDSLSGGAGNDVLWGNDGNDTLLGGTGADQMHGGAGDDIYLIDSTSDKIFEDADAGIDTVRSSVSFTLGANLENLQLLGTAAAGTGNAVDNALTGNASNNTLFGLGGNDFLDGMAGNDTLLGGDGNDTLSGGLGNDLMTGGAGQDVFVFNTAIGSRNIDRIADFSSTDDTIELDSHVFAALPTGALSAGAFQAAATSVASGAGIHVIFNTSTGALLYDPDGAGGAAAVQFATIVLTGLAGPVTAADFVVV